MAKQDRSGSKYERLLAVSLEALGFERNVETKKNYLQPAKNSEIVISGTYIQPDLVLRSHEIVDAVIYVSHWSNKRSSKYKFWRTWEELAQQRCALDEGFISINCIFEALPAGARPMVCRNASDLPSDSARDRELPQQLQGWDPGIGWAIVEAFDVSILFPVGFAPAVSESDSEDFGTTKMLRQALTLGIKNELCSQWKILRAIKQDAPSVSRSIETTASRFRIGLLHLYIVSRVFLRHQMGKENSLSDLIDAIALGNGQCRADRVSSVLKWHGFGLSDIVQVFETLSEVYTRSGLKPEMLCSLRRFEKLCFITLNGDLQKCLADIKDHRQNKELLKSINKTFDRFDVIYGVADALDDLNSLELVDRKEAFVRKALIGVAHKKSEYSALFLKFSTSESRASIARHQHNWFFEIALYIMGINSTEDLQKNFQAEFEKSGHKLRPHAPFGDTAATVIYLIQGIDVCCQWGVKNGNRTLTAEQFRELCWETVGRVVATKWDGANLCEPREVKVKYRQNKSWRIISSNLNGFYAIVEIELGDICSLSFGEPETNDLSILRQPSWATSVVSTIWGGRPLETWFEGVSNDGGWLIKVQSAQDGNEGHKTKELSGRCRAMHLEWKPGKDPEDRSKWKFGKRTMPKCALVLDGDWDRSKKKNLYEAGWDWVGDVSQLDELRNLIRG
jgi:hypothetical protein